MSPHHIWPSVATDDEGRIGCPIPGCEETLSFTTSRCVPLLAEQDPDRARAGEWTWWEVSCPVGHIVWTAADQARLVDCDPTEPDAEYDHLDLHRVVSRLVDSTGSVARRREARASVELDSHPEGARTQQQCADRGLCVRPSGHDGMHASDGWDQVADWIETQGAAEALRSLPGHLQAPALFPERPVSARDLLGIAPDYTGALSTQEYLDQQRDRTSTQPRQEGEQP